MLYALRSLIIAILIATSAWPAAAQQPGACGPLPSAMQQLADAYGEAPIALADLDEGKQVIVLATQDGATFTLLVTRNGIACLFGADEHWRQIDWHAPGHLALNSKPTH